MFSLEKQAFGPYDLYLLRYPDGGPAFSVAPARGAALLQLFFGKTPVLDGYDTPEALQEGKWGKSALLFPFPNRLEDGQYTWNGAAYQFPINHQATDNAIHGFVRNEIFEVDCVELGRHYAAITCSYAYSGRHRWYPFPFQLDVTYTMFANHTFRVAFRVRNLNTFAMPVGLGWHPYFRLGGDAEAHRLRLSPCERIPLNARMLPEGSSAPYADFAALQTLKGQRLDDCFRVSEAMDDETWQIELTGPAGRLTLSAATAHFPFFQVFTPDHGHSVALEPMTCNINAFNNGDGLLILAPDELWEGVSILRYSPA